MIPISDAISIIGRETRPLGVETVRLKDSVGRILADNVVADLDLPPFDRSQMDGFAVVAGDATVGKELVIIGESVAGKGFDGSLMPGQAVRIMTGARVPAGADAVQQVERTVEVDGRVRLEKSVVAGQNIVKRAAEVAAGDLVIRPGTMITDKMVATLASFGYSEVAVGIRPRVAVLATGSEIVDVASVPGKDQIRNSNSPMLESFLDSLGIESVIEPLVGDDLSALSDAIRRMLSAQPDIIILTGGVSVGDYDFTKPAILAAGGEIFFDKVSLKPGKPTVFGRIGETLVFGLPGNPVSVAVTFMLFVRFAIMLMMDAAVPELRRGRAVATARIKGARERDCVLPVSLATDSQGRLTISALRFSGSSNFIAFAAAEALVLVPRETAVEAGESAQIYFL